MADKITVLYAENKANKVFTTEGVETGTSFLHNSKVVELNDLKDLYEVLKKETKNPHAVIIRGLNESMQSEWVARNSENFPDTPHNWLMFDIDGFEPVMSDAVSDVEGSCKEFISYSLPEEFHDRDFIWHVSSKHGKNPDELRVHLFFWLKEAKDSPSLKNWSVGNSLPVDRSVFQEVQQHFISDPEFIDVETFFSGERLGYFWGDSSEVEIEIGSFEKKTLDLVLPSGKKGIVGDFHRRFTIDDVIDRILVGEFERMDDRRLTWVNSNNGAKGGAWIHEDKQHVGANHDSWPWGPHTLANLWDLVRVFKFGYADEGLDPFERMATHAPSQQLMMDWAKKELKKFSQHEQKLDCSAVKPLFDSIIWQMSNSLSMTDEELESEIGAEIEILCNFVEQCYWNTTKKSFYHLDGFEKAFSKEDFGIAFNESCQFFSRSKLKELISIASAGMSETNKEKFQKSVNSIPIDTVKKYLIGNKQATETSYEVDLFGSPARIVCESGTAKCVRNHSVFFQNEIDQAIVNDYKEHFPELDSFLDFVASSRIASSRREAYLWLHATSGFGKTLLIDMLNNVGGLCLNTHMMEIERAISGNASGLTVGSMIYSWAIVIDEFKSLKSEIKELTDTLRFSPKHSPMAIVPVYAKIFMSAESIDSLAGDSGVEDQFAKRFSYMRCEGEIDKRELFKEDKVAYKKSVTAYMAQYINARIEEYRQAGKNWAVTDANKRLSNFHETYAISKSFSSLEGNIASIKADFVSFVKEAIDVAKMGTSDREKREIYESAVVDSQGGLHLKRCAAIFKNWVDGEFDYAEARKVKYKYKDFFGDQIVIKGRIISSQDQSMKPQKVRSLETNLQMKSDFDDPLLD